MAQSDNWLEHAFRRTGWRPERQVVALAALGFAIALILGALYLSQVAREATTNRRLTALLEARDDLERINEQLRAEIAGLQSVPALRARAQELGFVEAGRGSIEYLSVEGYNPPRPDTVIEVEQVDVPEEAVEDVVYDERFTDWLGDQLEQIRDGINDLIGGGE